MDYKCINDRDGNEVVVKQGRLDFGVRPPQSLIVNNRVFIRLDTETRGATILIYKEISAWNEDL